MERDEEAEWKRERRTREKKRRGMAKKWLKKKIVATSYSKVLVVAPYCSKLLKFFSFGILDVEYVLGF